MEVVLATLVVSGIAVPSAVAGAVARTPVDFQNRGQEVPIHRVEQLMIRGLTRMYLEDFEGAVSVFDEALRLRPNDSALLTSMVQAKMGLGEFSSASFFLQQAIDHDGENASVWDLSAEVSSATGDFSALIRARQQLAQLRIKNPSAHLDLIRLLSRLDRFDEALQAAEVALGLLGEHPRILAERATALEKLGRVTDMDQTLIRLLEVEPSDISNQIQLGGSYIRQSLWEKAESIFLSVLAVEPDNLEAGMSLAVVLNHLGRSGEGDAILAEINSMNQAVAAAPENRVDFSSVEGLADASNDQLKGWLTEHPTDKEALQELAKRLITEGNPLQAADLYSRIVASHPRELKIWLAAIDAYISGGNNQLALDTAGKGLLLFPGYTPLLIGQVKALVAAGQTESALDAIQELLNQVTDPDQKAVLNGLLDQIKAM